MIKILKEAMTNMIRRIEILESQIKQMNSHQTIPPIITLATPGQIGYIRMLGGNPLSSLTKAEAGIEIDRLLKEKNAPQYPSISREIVEPEEVDTDDAGLDGELL